MRRREFLKLSGVTAIAFPWPALAQKDLAAAADYYRQNLAEDRGPYNEIHANLGLARVHLSAGKLDEALAACDRTAGLLGQHPNVRSTRVNGRVEG